MKTTKYRQPSERNLRLEILETLTVSCMYGDALKNAICGVGTLCAGEKSLPQKFDSALAELLRTGIVQQPRSPCNTPSGRTDLYWLEIGRAAQILAEARGAK